MLIGLQELVVMGACLCLLANRGEKKNTQQSQNPSTQNSETTKNAKAKNSSSVPLGKLTKFGYSTDFSQRYEKGKLLGHGQFGFTYAATSRSTGEKFAVKVIEKKKVRDSWNVFVSV